MRLQSVDFHNFRSACATLTKCSLEIDPEITCLLGTNESGKSNLLDAMAKFESGDFVESDVPRRMISGSNVTAEDDMPIISPTYQLDSVEIQRLEKLGISSVSRDQSVALTRNYKGPIYSADFSTRSITQVGADMVKVIPQFEEMIARFLRAYSRQKRNRRLAVPFSTSTSLWLHRFRDKVKISQFDSLDEIREIEGLYNRFMDSYQKLGQEAVERVQSRGSASSVIQTMTQLVQEMPSAFQGTLDDWMGSRPKFRLVSSDPSEWLKGEYLQSDILALDSNSPGLDSARLLLELAGLDFAKLQEASDSLMLDLLDEASGLASERLNRYWSQENITIKFQLSPKTGNLIIYVATEDHNGSPTQRSFGFRWYLEFMLAYAHVRESGEPAILLFDEPGIHLHPSAQEDLKCLLRQEISKHMQIIFTTHLPGMVDTARLDAIRGVVKNEQARPGTWVINEEYSPDHNQTTWEVMLKAVGAHGPAGFEPGRVVVVEGLSDQQYLINVARILDVEGKSEISDISSGVVRLHPGHGTKSLTPICQQMIKNQSRFIILLDRDQAGNQAKTSLEGKYHPPNEWFRLVIQVTDPQYEDNYFPENGDYEIEDLFGADLYSDMVNRAFATHVESAGPFNLPTTSPPSMSKKSAEAWLESTGQDPDLIYMVANQFADMLSAGDITLPTEVKSRFAVLLEHVVKATDLS